MKDFCFFFSKKKALLFPDLPLADHVDDAAVAVLHHRDDPSLFARRRSCTARGVTERRFAELLDRHHGQPGGEQAFAQVAAARTPSPLRRW